MQINRRKANFFKSDTFIEKKNCQRCYRLHKKCDGGTPNCSRCAKAKSACIYHYNPAENKLSTLDTSKVDLEINVKNLQHSLEQQNQAFQLLQEQFEQIQAQNLTLQTINAYLSQALSANIIDENYLASASEKQDLLGIYRNTGYLHIRVTPPFSDMHHYKQEKALGRNPLKTVAMEFILGAMYLLLGKRNEGYHYMNTARDEMMAYKLNSPMGLICMFMMAENYLIAGKKIESTPWLQKINAMFTEMENNMTDPNKTQLVNNQMMLLSQLIDVNFVRTISILWTQWAPQYFKPMSHDRRIDQYLRQVEIAKILESSIHQSPCGVPTFYFLKNISEIIIAIEHEINCSNDIQFVTEQTITTNFMQLIKYSQLTNDSKLRETFMRSIVIIKILVAILTSNYMALDQLIVEMMEMGCFTDTCPIPQDAVPLFIVLQLLCNVQSPYFPQAVQQYEAWSKSFPTYSKLYEKWVDIATGPSIYPVELQGFEDYFVVLPHLHYMQQRNIPFKMHLPILCTDSAQIVDVVDSLLLTPFDASSSIPSSVSHYNTLEKSEQYSDNSNLSDETFAFNPPDFIVAYNDMDEIVQSSNDDVYRFI